MDIQAVLEATGIPTYAGSWQASTADDIPPEQYIVYTYARAPDQSADNAVAEYVTYAYVNLWSASDPTTVIALVRAAAEAAGWGMIDERGAMYEDGCYRTSWTFVGWD